MKSQKEVSDFVGTVETVNLEGIGIYVIGCHYTAFYTAFVDAAVYSDSVGRTVVMPKVH